jgi:hypothetical protein
MSHQATRHEDVFNPGTLAPARDDFLAGKVMTKDSAGKTSEPDGSYPSDLNGRTQTISYFILTVLGFSFWFFMAVPFASHRESYHWLATIRSHPFAYAFSNSMSVTYRPLGEVAGWLGFSVLGPSVFPTSVLRQALLQGFVYGMFVFAWWLIYRAAGQRRLFALIAFVTGGVFFSGYVHLFHIYGLMYVPVMLTLGALLYLHASGSFGTREVWLAVLATVLAFWHPFATALFVGFYFGFYLQTFRRRSAAQHVQAVLILLIGMLAIAALAFVFARADAATMPLRLRLLGFLVSYQTTEVNRIASLVAFLLTQLVVFSMGLSSRLKLVALLLVSAVSVLFVLKSLPLLLLWLCVVLIKLFRLRSWGLFFLTLTAVLFPFGGGIGTPIFALFGVIAAVYVTDLGWRQAEKVLGFAKPSFAIGIIIASAIVILMVRVGVEVPVVTEAAAPLLTERERTYQLEDILAWLHNSQYCGYGIDFIANAGSPIDSPENIITRRNRPPADIEDVGNFWNAVLRCRKVERANHKAGTAIVTFGGPGLADATPVFEVGGKYAGAATVWVKDITRTSASSVVSRDK